MSAAGQARARVPRLTVDHLVRWARSTILEDARADIDARRPIIWDMGKIASYGTPEALDLFVSVMMASASIPVGFPPVMIDVEIDGKPYEEMHVDGGASAQVFVYPPGFGVRAFSREQNVTRERRLHVCQLEDHRIRPLAVIGTTAENGCEVERCYEESSD